MLYFTASPFELLSCRYSSFGFMNLHSSSSKLHPHSSFIACIFHLQFLHKSSPMHIPKSCYSMLFSFLLALNLINNHQNLHIAHNLGVDIHICNKPQYTSQMTLNNTKYDSKLTQNMTLKHAHLTHIKHPQTYTCLSSSNNSKS